MLEKFLEDYLPWEGPHAEAGEETTCDEMITTPILHPSVTQGEEVEKSGAKRSLGRREGLRGRCFKTHLSLSYSDF